MSHFDQRIVALRRGRIGREAFVQRQMMRIPAQGDQRRDGEVCAGLDVALTECRPARRVGRNRVPVWPVRPALARLVVVGGWVKVAATMGMLSTSTAAWLL